MDKVTQLVEMVRGYGLESFGNRSLIKKLVSVAEERGELNNCLQQSLDILTVTDFDVMPLTILCNKLAANMAAYLDVQTAGRKQVISAGAVIMDWFAQCDMITVEKREQVKERNGKMHMNDVWYAVPLDIEKEESSKDSEIFCDPRKPFRPWTTPTRYENGVVVPIVKKADRHGLLNNYTEDKIPLQYRVLNRLAETPWVINEKLYSYAAMMDPDNSPLPVEPTAAQVFMANKTYADVKASRAKRKAAKRVLRAKGQRKQVTSAMELAEQYRGYELNFTYNCGSNSRMYCLAPTLTPQGSDLCKALLWCNDETPIHVDDFYWHLANCAGQDKLEHGLRRQWVLDHMADLRKIGQDPINQWELIQQLGVHKEKKTYFQFIACCIELERLHLFLALGGDVSEFTTGILLGMDSTSSGNQILAMLACDDQVAWEVNIEGGEGRGDLYGKIGKAVHQALKELTTDDCEAYLKIKDLSGLKKLSELPEGHKIFRNITKRPCMVLPYSGTRRGAADIMVEDQDDFNIEEIKDLGWAECRQLGYVIHDQCKIAAKRSMEIMEFLIDGIAGVRESVEYEGKVIDAGTPTLITWRIPQTNFLCFQYKEASNENHFKYRIGGIDTDLTFYLPKPHKVIKGRKVGSTAKHKNAVAPGVVHSLDATLMALIVDGLPSGIPVTAIHDQFCVPTGYWDELVAVARDAYISVGSRDNFKELTDAAFGERELPQKGSWKPENLATSAYFIS